jgi:arylsulfatase
LASEALMHGFKNGDTKEVAQVDSIEAMAEGDRLLKEFTVQKLKELAKKDKPFFIEHCFMKVHADNFPSKEFEGKSGSKYPYKDALVEVDAYIGEIVEALESDGILENTFIFITQTAVRSQDR